MRLQSRRQPQPPESTTTRLTPDDVFEILSNHRRRYTLYYLTQRDSISLGELAEHIAAKENQIERTTVSSTERKRVYTSLQQVHLPKLNELAVITFDERSGKIQLGPNSHALDAYLPGKTERNPPWSTVYGALAVIYAGILSGAVLDIPPFALLPDLFWALLVPATLALAAITHRVMTNRANSTWSTAPPPDEQ